MLKFSKASYTFSVLQSDFSNLQDICSTFQATPFSPDAGQGFDDLQLLSDCITGKFINLYDFEVKYYDDGIIATEAKKKLISCEFMITPEYAFVSGDGPAKSLFTQNLQLVLSGITGLAATKPMLDFDNMEVFENRLDLVTDICCKNPRGSEAVKVTLSGRIEDYSTCNSLVPGRYEILYVKGKYVRPDKSYLTLKLTRKGQLTVRSKSGFNFTPSVADSIMGLTKTA